MKIRIPNTTGGQAPPDPPARPDGLPYAYEMVFASDRWYADTLAELAAELIPGYADLTDDHSRLRSRIRYATAVHVPIQAELATEPGLAACTPGQRDVILSSRDVPPAVTSWKAPVPLVLVTSFYPAHRPAEDGGEIIWIDPLTEESLLVSLAAAGWISVARRGAVTGDRA